MEDRASGSGKLRIRGERGRELAARPSPAGMEDGMEKADPPDPTRFDDDERVERQTDRPDEGERSDGGPSVRG